jgi:hypothetical protein
MDAEGVINVSLKYIIQEKIAKELENQFKNVRGNVEVINESKSKKGDYKPYTIDTEDNLYKEIDETIKKCYSNKGLNEMRALASSSALTYNTFCNVSEDNNLVYNGETFHTFLPESKRHPLNFSKSKDQGKSNIDAELIGNDKVLMVETKMFEPYYFSIKKTLDKLDKYLDPNFYSDEVFSIELKAKWIELFSHFKDNIKDEDITNFDVIQLLKHLLSIVNSKESFNGKKVELLALTWHASLTTINLGSNREDVKRYDINTIEQCKEAIGIMNKFLVDNNYDWINVNTYDYIEFVWRTNLYDDAKLFEYLKRYTDISNVNIKEIMTIELPGLVQTVSTVSRDHFITSYANQLGETKYPEDERYIKILVPKILSWYDDGEYESLLLSPYTYNSQTQVKTYQLLNLMDRLLETKTVKPIKQLMYKEKPPIEIDDSFEDIFKI